MGLQPVINRLPCDVSDRDLLIARTTVGLCHQYVLRFNRKSAFQHTYHTPLPFYLLAREMAMIFALDDNRPIRSQQERIDFGIQKLAHFNGFQT